MIYTDGKAILIVWLQKCVARKGRLEKSLDQNNTKHLKLRFTILICDLVWNLIEINKFRLTEVRDPSLTSMHFETVKQSFIGDKKKIKN